MTDSPHRVQGLADDEVAADWPPISAQEIAALGALHPRLHGRCTLRWCSPRPFSAAAIIDTATGAVFLKRHHHSVRSVDTLLEEHRFIEHLARQGMPVVQLLPDAQGATAFAHGRWTYELHSVAPGHDLYRDAASWTPVGARVQAQQAGRMLARLHQASASYRAPQRQTHILVARDDLIRADDPIAALQQQLPGRPALADYLGGRDWQRQLGEDVLALHAGLPAKLRGVPRQWAHNDWHVSNLLWRAEPQPPGISAVFDFGLASPTSALFDLATAIERNAIAWLALDGPAPPARTDIASGLVQGYSELQPLGPEQLGLLAALLPVVHLDFALSEVEYFHGITGSTANADVAWYTFLLGHARWFRSSDGQQLLDTLRGAQ